VAGLNVIVFTLITILAHQEKLEKKRDGQLNPRFSSSDSSTPSIGDGNEKKIPLVDEEDVTLELKH
jgi:ACS family pantothenate transporter-like MFS transporter